jgi:hypothetical protein
MKHKSLTILVAILWGIACVPITRAAIITNNWTSTGGKWEIGSNWSAGTPSPANFLDSITIAFPAGSRFITIDAATVSSNVINECLVISNLTVGGTLQSPNTLILNTDASNTPGNMGLTVGDSLTISSHGVISITNSYLYANGPGFFDDGFMVLNSGTLFIAGTTTAYIGYTGMGQMTMQGGYFQSSAIQVGTGGTSQGTLTIAGGIFNMVASQHDNNGLLVGADNGSGGATVWLTGGQVIQTNSGTQIYSGQMTVSNGLWLTVAIGVGFGQGTLTIAGGSITITGASPYDFTIGGLFAPPCTVWMTGGTLLAPGGCSIGLSSTGNMTVSNGTWRTGFAIVGDDPTEDELPGTGAVTVVGGTVLFSSLHMGFVTNSLGSIWVTGGSLTVTNAKTYVGETGNGYLAVSNGTFLANEIDVGASSGALGILASAGGQLVVTNGAGRIAVGVAGSDPTSFSAISGSGNGHMSVAVNGSVLTRELDIGSDDSPQGELSISSSGSLTVQSRMTVGDCDSNGFGIVVMSGGKLYVTNATHNATLEVRNGFFLLEGGTVVVDKLVMTNGCSGIFDRSGGTLTAGTIVLDPNGDADGDGLPNWWEQAHGLDPLSSAGDNGPDGDPDGDGYNNVQEYEAGSDPQNPLSTPLQIVAPPFQFTSMVRSGNNIVLTWNTAGGLTNQLQVTGGGGGGTYSTNTFTNLGAQMLIGGSDVITTNYTDIGGATNKPARYYRVRLVP